MQAKTICSFDEYIRYTEKYRGNSYFRGQADASWNITPTISRANSTISSLDDEQRVVADNISEDSSKLSFLRMPIYLASLFRLQHYGTHTRICDLSISNLSALWFAVEGHTSADGAVFILDSTSAVDADGVEMNLFSKVFAGERNIATLQSELGDCGDARTILTRNCIVKHKDMLFNNSRSFRQGGTGIVFGYGLKDGKLSLTDNTDISDFICEKIIIPCHVKQEIYNTLRKLGYSKDALYDESDGYQAEDVSLIQEGFEAHKGIGISGMNYKIEGKYRVSTLYFEPGVLALKITRLYENLFAEYGNNAQIWTFYYFDENDIGNINWICRGEWDKEVGYKLVWYKDYRTKRLHFMNSKVASSDVINLAEGLIDEIMPYYEAFVKCVATPDYNFNELLELVLEMRAELTLLNKRAGDIPASDYNTKEFIEAAQLLVFDVYNIAEHTIMHSNYTHQPVATKKRGMDWNFEECRKSLNSYLEAKNNYYSRG